MVGSKTFFGHEFYGMFCPEFSTPLCRSLNPAHARKHIHKHHLLQDQSHALKRQEQEKNTSSGKSMVERCFATAKDAGFGPPLGPKEHCCNRDFRGRRCKSVGRAVGRDNVLLPLAHHHSGAVMERCGNRKFMRCSISVIYAGIGTSRKLRSPHVLQRNGFILHLPYL